MARNESPGWSIIEEPEAKKIRALPRRGRGHISPLTQALMDGNMVLSPRSRANSTYSTLRKQGYRLRSRSAEDGKGIYLWAEKMEPESS